MAKSATHELLSAMAQFKTKLTDELVVIPSVAPMRRRLGVTNQGIRDLNLERWRRSDAGQMFRRQCNQPPEPPRGSFTAWKIKEALAMAQAATVARRPEGRAVA